MLQKILPERTTPSEAPNASRKNPLSLSSHGKLSPKPQNQKTKRKHLKFKKEI